MLSKSVCQKCEMFKTKCLNCQRDNCWACKGTSHTLQRDFDVPKGCPYALEHLMKTQASGATK